MAFFEQTPPEIQNLEDHLTEKDWKALRATAHKIKPSLGFMGIKELEDTIKSIEEYASKEINLEQLPELVAKVKNICTEAIEELKVEKELYK